MGWRLAEEIAWARPERPGPEWWTLMDIAQDARDSTRQGTPGMEYLMARGKCGKRTVMRRLELLREQELITIVRKAAPGIRAVYRVAEVRALPATGDTNADTRTGVTNADTRSPDAAVNGCQKPAQRVSETGPTGVSVRVTPPVTHPSEHPSQPTAPVVTPSVEVHVVNGRKMSNIEYAAWQQVNASRQERGNHA